MSHQNDVCWFVYVALDSKNISRKLPVLFLFGFTFYYNQTSVMSEDIELKLELLCRLCSSVISNGSHLISDNLEGTKLADQIWECLQIKVLI